MPAEFLSSQSAAVVAELAVGTFHLVGHDRLGIDDTQPRQRRIEGAVGFGQRNDRRERIRRFRGFDPAVEQEGVALLQGQDTVHREDDVIGRHGVPGMKLDVGPQLDRVDRARLVDVDALGKMRDHVGRLAVERREHQHVVDVVHENGIGEQRTLMGVDVAVVGLANPEGGLRRRRIDRESNRKQ